ncbi:MAG: hypothetical protein GY875_09395 [Gammaproteobacteria bacterium]|nr:hypothetical protein [Gammaproteobacteria bacterium]
MGEASVIGLDFTTESPPTLYAATGYRALRLEDGSDTWEDITGNLPTIVLRQVLQNPLTGDLYAAGDSGIYRSPLGSETGTWIQMVETPSRLLHMSAGGILVHAAALAGSLLMTGDEGANWFPTHEGLQNIFVGGLATSDTGGNSVIFAGTDSGSFTTSDLFSTPEARLWAKDQNLVQKVFTSTVLPSQPGSVLVGTENAGVWQSDDWGINWVQRSEGLVPRKIFSVKQSPVGTGTLYAGTSEGLYLSRNNGANWSKATAAAEPQQVFSVEPHPVFAGVAYFGATDGAIFATLNDGNGVFRIAAAGLPQGEAIRTLRIAPWSNFHVITSSGTYFASADQGKNWFSAMNGVSEIALSMDFDPDQPWMLYLGTAGGGVYKSVDGGLSWTPSNDGLDVPFVFSLAVDPAMPETVYAGTVGEVYKSSDGGLTWSDLGTGLPGGHVSSLVIDPNDSDVLMAAIMDDGIYKSEDAGATWNLQQLGGPSEGTYPLAINPAQSQIMYVGTELEGLHRSTDGGASWSASSSGMSLFIRGLAVHPLNESLLFATSLSNGIFRSVDGADSWINMGLHDEYLFDVAVDPGDTQRVFVATEGGVNRSTDGGASWILLGQRSSAVFSALADPLDPSRVFIGGFAGGL